VLLVVILRGKIQDFMLARQWLYNLSHMSSPFFFGYFCDRVSLYTWLVWTTTRLELSYMLRCVAGMTDVCQLTQSLVEI
jgi:hypothetical protein